MKIKKWFSTFAFTLSLFLAGCGNTETVKTKEKNSEIDILTVFTTIYPLEDFTKKIGGNHVDVKSIYPPNVDAHSYEPSTKNMITMAKSDLFIYTGVGIEGFAEKAAETLQKENVHTLKAADGIHLLEIDHKNEHQDEGEDAETEHHNDEETTEEHSLEEDHHDHGDIDPHVWLDPVLSIELARNIKDSLIELMPQHTSEFEANFNKLEGDLKEIDQEFKSTIESSKTKSLLVAHGAYGYWEKRYGIEQISIAGLSPTQEPTQKGLEKIVEESTKHNIHYVIFEQNASPKVAEIIQQELGAKSLSLHNLEAITEENIKNKDDYFSIMRENLKTIKIALND